MPWTSRLWGLAQRSAATLLELVYPTACAGCGRHGFGAWCARCSAGARWLHGPSAVRAIAPVDAAPLSIYSSGVFADELRSAVHALKFESRPQMARALAPQLTKLWREHDIDAHCIVAVPLHPSRERERGYNQSALLAAALAAEIGVPFHPRAVRRTRATRQQALLSQAERSANVAGAFLADRPLLEGRRVMIIDDVFTTGSTLAAAAVACRDAGAASVAAMTVARAE
jgi:ComF family protein